MSKDIKIYLNLLAVNLKTMLNFRLDFILLVISGSLTQILGIVFLFTLFNKIPNIVGWTLYEIILIYSFVYIIEGIVSLFFDGAWNLTSIINSGEFDRILMRPVSPLVQIVTLGIGTQGLGNMLIGIILLIYSLNHSPILQNPFIILLIVLFIITGVIVKVSINLCTSALSFWTKNGNPLMIANQSLSEFSKYPVSIYNKGVRSVVLIIPYMFISFVPVSFLLHKDHSYIYISLYPVILLYVVLLARLLFKKGIRRYESVGN